MVWHKILLLRKRQLRVVNYGLCDCLWIHDCKPLFLDGIPLGNPSIVVSQTSKFDFFSF